MQMLSESISDQPVAGGRVASELLSDVPLFQPLNLETRRAIARHCRTLQFRAQEVVVRQSDCARNVYFVVSGRLRSVVYSADGKEVAFAEFVVGDYFGECPAIDRLEQQTSVIALADVRLLCLPAAVFRQLLQNHAGLAFAVTKNASLQIRRLSERVCEYTTLGVGERVRAEVLRLAWQRRCQPRRSQKVPIEIKKDNSTKTVHKFADASASAAVIIDDFPTHADFANRISTHREAVTREINRLERAGFVERNHGEFIVADIDALQRLVSERRAVTLH